MAQAITGESLQVLLLLSALLGAVAGCPGGTKSAGQDGQEGGSQSLIESVYVARKISITLDQ